ncbi:MAG: sigma-70 family RNA polymerase sigma factor [Holophagales bacterium]|nr:MAG: sigma-70 family RNA polymerase sigma factor [Holophagales bacterium]
MEPQAAASPPSLTVDRHLVDVALSFARRFALRAQDAEDIAQEALLRLLRYDGEIASPVAWLFVVIRRLAIAPQRPAEEMLPERLAGSDPWPIVELELDTRRLLAALPRRARHALGLALAGYSEVESAARLGCSVKATEKALHRARREARRRLAAG